MKIPKLLMIKLSEKQKCDYPTVKAIGDGFIIVSREGMKVR